MTDGTPPCKTCPFLRSNQGKRTAGGFYSRRNLQRMWARIRQGELLICHSTDPEAWVTGSPTCPKKGQIKPGNEQACRGALYMVKREDKTLLKSIDAGTGFSGYARAPEAAKPPMTPLGFLAIAETVMLAGSPLGTRLKLYAPDMDADVGLPWEPPK